MNFIKEYWIAIVVLALVLVGSIILSQKDDKVTGTGSTPKQTEQQTKTNTTIEPVKTAPKTQETMGTSSSWQGTLKISDDTTKGNFVLVMPDHAIYIRTSRDYSELVGKEVTVSYTGTLENFILMDIEPAQ